MTNMPISPYNSVGGCLLLNNHRGTTEVSPIRPATSIVGQRPRLEVLFHVSRIEPLCMRWVDSLWREGCRMHTAQDVVRAVQVGVNTLSTAGTKQATLHSPATIGVMLTNR